MVTNEALNIEQRVCELLRKSAGVTLRQAGDALSMDKHSIRIALGRLKSKGVADSVFTYGVKVYFLVRDAPFPTDNRGGNRRRRGIETPRHPA